MGPKSFSSFQESLFLHPIDAFLERFLRRAGIEIQLRLRLALGVRGRVYVPRTTPRQKRDRMAALGGDPAAIMKEFKAEIAKYKAAY